MILHVAFESAILREAKAGFEHAWHVCFRAGLHCFCLLGLSD